MTALGLFPSSSAIRSTSSARSDGREMVFFTALAIFETLLANPRRCEHFIPLFLIPPRSSASRYQNSWNPAPGPRRGHSWFPSGMASYAVPSCSTVRHATSSPIMSQHEAHELSPALAPGTIPSPPRPTSFRYPCTGRTSPLPFPDASTRSSAFLLFTSQKGVEQVTDDQDSHSDDPGEGGDQADFKDLPEDDHRGGGGDDHRHHECQHRSQGSPRAQEGL